MAISLVMICTYRPLLPDQWMSDVYSGLAFQTLRGPATSIELRPLCPPAQKSNPAPVSDAHKKVEIQGKRLSTGKDPATAAVLIPALDVIRSAADDLA
jgi:hypothetical protein